MTARAVRTSKGRPTRFGLGANERRNLKWGLLFISPWLFGFITLSIFPILYTFYLSLTRYSGIRDPVFIGIQNYQRMVADPLFLKSAYNTLYYTLLAVPIGVVVAMVLAIAMNQKIREVSIYRAIYYLPSILPVFAISFIFVVLLNPGYGLINWVLISLGLPSPNWLGDPAYTKLALVMIAQLGAGQWALVFLAGLRGIPIELYESAEIDGAGQFRIITAIKLPAIRGALVIATIFSVIGSFQLFNEPAILRPLARNVLTTGYTPNMYAYSLSFAGQQYNYAATVAIIMGIITMVIAYVVQLRGTRES
jgi:multiple sugar transport system permease protein